MYLYIKKANHSMIGFFVCYRLYSQYQIKWIHNIMRRD
ncbi:hypothetical protein M917_1417 [Psychrobacter aquaticus CMS 56]|uniref:Uncharacterized protein n=1 Tax=Psychrobacter aquaticus CMS 56 TaxID=1354303 RepID=U4T471_9GAMM|nr:hypothetical protein M917_1417 [Psychrobacter aquaticus CMS 56]